MAKQLRIETVDEGPNGEINVNVSFGEAPLPVQEIGVQGFGWANREELRTYIEDFQLSAESLTFLALQKWLADDPNMVNLSLPVGNIATLDMESNNQPVSVTG